MLLFTVKVKESDTRTLGDRSIVAIGRHAQIGSGEIANRPDVFDLRSDRLENHRQKYPHEQVPPILPTSTVHGWPPCFARIDMTNNRIVRRWISYNEE